MVHAAGMSLSKDRSRAYCVTSSVHLAMASRASGHGKYSGTVEAQTAEEGPGLSRVTGSP